MANYIVRIEDIVPRTHDVNTYRVSKPTGFVFVPGQATDLSINQPQWVAEKRPFTFTALPSDHFLEFTIKSYADRGGVTNHLLSLKPGDEFEISDAWGAINYQGEGSFIAGGAGITPFISIFRQLQKDHQLGNSRLIFSNKTEGDIILKSEFEQMLGKHFINVITRQPDTHYPKGKIDKAFLQKYVAPLDGHFYVCGPDPFTEAILDILKGLGASAQSLVFEK